MTDLTALSLDAKLAFLRQPSSYPEQTWRVEAVETHMSWVFLTESFAYKLKKPVCYGVIDFRTIEARHFYCDEEIRLNRRLAPHVYIDAVPLSIDAHGHLHLCSNGRVTDWLVKMHRLPSMRMLDYAIRKNAVDETAMREIAATLADFYRHAASMEMGTAEFCGRMEKEIGFNLTTLTLPVYALPVDRLRQVCTAQLEFLHQNVDRFDGRVRMRKIVEGHGDLRPEHVCLGPPLSIIDCLEFSRDLRSVDAAEEVAFLALECERLGAPQLSATLLAAYTAASGDAPDAALVHFYQSYRACTRARIAILHLNEEKFRHSAEWRRRAIDYLRLAEKHAERY